MAFSVSLSIVSLLFLLKSASLSEFLSDTPAITLSERFESVCSSLTCLTTFAAVSASALTIISETILVKSSSS